ncbi:Phosphomevalonate kinase [Panus rudis PR-1116 ss-1]|nr:Phosphomevalonate kinase [Panus rudis PR-1116 ss-1]
MTTPTVVSSPGKVLLAGGYLVLDPAYSGVVVSTSSRFYTVVSNSDKRAAGGESGVGTGNRVLEPLVQIRVRSPQFVNAAWAYALHLYSHNNGEDVSLRIEQVADGSTSNSRNKFVQLAIQRTVALALELKGAEALKSGFGHDLEIVIVGDNDFYSQRQQLSSKNLPPTLASLSQLPPFLPTGVIISDVHKTGLGSSAALITSLVSALLLHLNVIPSESFNAEAGSSTTSEGRRLAHNLAQYVHCLAQGKVGSGFDVSAAVFGSQIYTRFDPAVIQPLMTDEVAPGSLRKILSPSNSAWNYKAEPFQLPPFVRLMLADVDAGSDTPSLVGKVLKWRQDNVVEAKELWNAINKVNQSLSRDLLQLSDLAATHPSEYKKMIGYLSSVQTLQWLAHPETSAEEREIGEVFLRVRQTSEGIRAHMRRMGSLSGVPIEPPEQTQLLDACISVAGVIGGGVPGAGGYDAIWLLVFDPAEVPEGVKRPSERVETLWSTWKGLDVSPLLATESKEKGVRLEKLESIPGLKEAIHANN